MFKRNKIYTVVAASALITFSAMSTAQETETSTATVTVANSFNLVEDAALSFGQLAVFQSLDVDGPGGNAAGVRAANQQPTYVVASSDPAGGDNAPTAAVDVANTVSRIVEITPGTPAAYSITAATQFTNLTVTPPNQATIADPTIDGALNSTFTVDITLADMTIVGGPNDGSSLGGGSAQPLRTDSNGAVGFRVGATLTPNETAAAILDGNYVGSFDITVSY